MDISFSAASDNVDDDGESVKLTFGSSLPTGVTKGSTGGEAVVSITDDDVPNVTVSFGQDTYTVDEGSSVTVKVKLDEDPERTVTIPITATDQDGASGDDYSGVPARVTFNSGDTEVDISFSAASDNVDDDGESVKLTFGSLPDGVSASGTTEATVNITDDDTAGVTVNPTSLTLDEGGTATYTVVLDTEPTGDVTVTIQDPTDNTDVTAGPASLAFTDQNWDTAQTVTVSAAQDDNAGDETATITHTVAGYGTVTTADDVTVAVADDAPDSLAVSFGQDSYTVAEGSNVTVKVKLDADPERTVTIPITATDQDGASGDDYSGVPARVTFNSGDTEVGISFSAASDNVDDDGESVKLTFGSLPDGVSASGTTEATVNITDDDTAGVTVNPTSLTLDEGGTATYTVVLDTEPTGDVTVTIQDPTDNTDVTAGPASLAFTDQNWDTAQTVTVSAAQDDNAGDETATITHTVAGYGTVTTADDVTVAVADDAPDSLAVSFEQDSYTVAEGSNVTVKVKLDADPERTVTIPITATDQDGASGDDYSGVPARVTFNSGDTEVDISFSAASDNVDDDGESVKLTFGSLPDGVSASGTTEATVNITDDDTAGVTVNPTSLTLDEGGTATYTVVLDTEPTGDVTVTIQDPTDNTDVTAGPASLAFTDQNWDTAQTVTVSAAQDDNAGDETATITHTVAGYGTAADETVTATDDAPDGQAPTSPSRQAGRRRGAPIPGHGRRGRPP